jgi:hypothetical protein
LEAARVLGVPAGHEHRHLLVAHLDEIHGVPGARDGAYYAVNAVSRVAEDAPYPPVAKPLNEEIRNRLSHDDERRKRRAYRTATSAERSTAEHFLLSTGCLPLGGAPCCTIYAACPHPWLPVSSFDCYGKVINGPANRDLAVMNSAKVDRAA